MDIKQYRDQINSLDEQIVALIEKRMDAASGIGLEKKRQGLPVFDVVREAERIETVKALTKNDLYREHIGNIYRNIMDETKLVEQELIDKE